MDFDLEQALRDHPLPAGVEDAVLNLSQLAVAMQVSDTTIAKWRMQGLPVMTSGQNGREYEFQLAACYAWREARDQANRSRREAGDRAAAQMALMFRNTDEPDSEGPVLTAKDIEEEARADYQRQRAAELRGELVRTVRVRELLEDLLVQFRTALETLPDFCEREFGLTPAQVDKLQARTDAAILETRRRIDAEMLGRASDGAVTPLHAVQESMGL